MLGEKKVTKFRARGSVSRSMIYHRRMQTDLEFRNRYKKSKHDSYLKRKKKFNKRCLNCNKLINPKSTYCNSCKDN
jgi:rRNA maturation endonuclease Nob1